MPLSTRRMIGLGVVLGIVLAIAWGIVLAAGCTEAKPDTVLAVFDLAAESDPGAPLEGVWITVDGQPVGRSSATGPLRTSIARPPGTTIRVEHDCPAGFRDPVEPKLVKLSHDQGVGGAASPVIELALPCPPSERVVVIAVRAENGADLPVLLDDRVESRTGSTGVAHLSTTAPPGTELSVRLDTSERPKLVPQNPRRVFEVPDSDEAFLFDQRFEIEKPTRRKRKPRRKITKIE